MKQERRSIRLKEYDYSLAGAYFVTICAHKRECLFGEVLDGQMRLNDAGRLIQAAWESLPEYYPHVVLDVWVVMPNHFHGVIILVGAGLKPAQTENRHGLPEIVRAMKTFSSRRINEMRGTSGVPVWQRNYFERVIRNDNEMHRSREYIVNNPAKWDLDRENPVNSYARKYESEIADS
jgi:REP element-mobilizing transposase RayT